MTEQVGLKLGYEWDLPLQGTTTFTSKRISGFGGKDTTWERTLVRAPSRGSQLKVDQDPALSIHNLVAGAAIRFRPRWEVTFAGKYGLNGSVPEYQKDPLTGAPTGKLMGAASSAKNTLVRQLGMGIRFTL